MTDRGVEVERVVGRLGEFHARAVPPLDRVTMWVVEVDRPTIVLGSRQGRELLLHDVEQRYDVIPRRSGGGLVRLVPEEVVWIDVVVPPGAPQWSDDVHRTMVNVGEAWATAIGSLAPEPAEPLEVHRGGMCTSPWSELVCFAGLGPGEVVVGDVKLVGLSQRRTRQGARVQGAVHRHVDLRDTVAEIAADAPGRPTGPPDVPRVGALGDELGTDELVERLRRAVEDPTPG